MLPVKCKSKLNLVTFFSPFRHSEKYRAKKRGNNNEYFKGGKQTVKLQVEQKKKKHDDGMMVMHNWAPSKYNIHIYINHG